MINTLIDLWTNIPIAMLLISALAWVFINAEEPFDLATPLINTQAGLDMVNNRVQRITKIPPAPNPPIRRPNLKYWALDDFEEYCKNHNLPMYENPPKMPVIRPPSQPSKRL